jgi:hypothetical protein
MFILIPPALPVRLANAIGLMGAHLVFDTELQAKEALIILAPNYANQFQVVNLEDVTDFEIMSH